ncbi:MAG TPA: hypothetical protein VMS88_02385, partial [Terriglobales bacterium]|nr:hypothetical protein [Terriglobales bacterium]
MRATALLLLALLAPGGAARALPARVWTRGIPPARALAARGKAAAFIRVDRTALADFRREAAGQLELPLPDGSSLGLSLSRFDVLAPGATVTVTGPHGPMPFRPDLTLFRGTVDGEPDSWAVIAMSEDEVSGVIERSRGRLVVSPLNRAGLAPGEADHAVSEAPDVTPPGGSFVCPADDLPRVGPEPPAALPA